MLLVGLAVPLAIAANREIKAVKSTAVSNGLEVVDGLSRLRVEFVRADIVRVQYQEDFLLLFSFLAFLLFLSLSCPLH